MFEVEKKFILRKNDIEKLIQGAEFLGEKKFTDVYFDSPDYALSKNNMWLRKRDKKWKLKIPAYQTKNKMIRQFEEIEGEDKLREIFGIAPSGDFSGDIAKFGYAPFCTCTTSRKKYKRGKFNIDVDRADYGSSKGGLSDLVYECCEIEVMVSEASLVEGAASEIENFARENGLKMDEALGKVGSYLFHKKPAHFQALVEAGVINIDKV